MQRCNITMNRTARILLLITLSCLLIFGLAGCRSKEEPADTEPEDSTEVIDDDYEESEDDKVYDMTLDALDTEKLESTILEETEDAGQEYLDNTLFIGDSNTVRSMMYGHTTWDNVVAAVSMGVQHIPSLKMTFFKGMNDGVTVPDAVQIIQPQRIIITYGTNNFGYAVETFIEKYKTGLDAIKEKWPHAEIIINSVPPIDRQRENLSITMQVIDKFNKALADFCKEEGYKFLNSSEALKDETTGFAKTDYTIGDGIHLSKLGMDAMFNYFRTHAYITEDTRPKPLKAVPERKETPSGIITQDPHAVRGTRIRIYFASSDPSLGRVDGEVEQKLKRTVTSSAVTAVANTENGGVFTGWSCSYGGLSSTSSATVRFTVPQVPENVTEIIITANFKKEAKKLPLESISLSGDSSVEAGKTAKLKLSLNPGNADADKEDAKWSSSNTAVAKVSSSGKVTGVSAGSATITCTLDGFTATHNITVKAAAKECGDVGHTKEGTCPACGAVYAAPACGDVGHTKDGTCPSCGAVYAAPACGAVGHTKEGTCPSCGAVYAAPACGAVGHTADGTCPVCGSTYSAPKCGAVGHTADGTCPVCGSTYSAPKCGAAGHTADGTCPVCGSTYTTPPPAPEPTPDPPPEPTQEDPAPVNDPAPTGE